jgi:hypothetical protein
MTKNAFQKITPTKATSSKTKVNKITADVTDEIKLKVDTFVRNKATLKQLEAEQLTIETEITEHVRPQQDELAFCGTFTKSLKVPGNDFEITFVTMDKFSVPQDEEPLAAIKKLVGDTRYDEMFASKETLSLKEHVVKNEKGELDKLAEACKKAGINVAEYFDRVEKVYAKDDLDRKQYELKASDLNTFRSLVKQAKPSLK